jgi:uncharacterized DUF497 family protein
MKITFDPVKRASTLRDRSLDFADAAEIFAGNALIFRTNATTMASPGLSPWACCAGEW